MTKRSPAVHKKAVRPRRPRHRAEPPVANHKRLRQRMQHRKRSLPVIRHHLRPVRGHALRIVPLEVRYKSHVLFSRARPTHLRQHIGKIVCRIALHLARHRRRLRHRRSRQIRVRSWMRSVHSIDARNPTQHPVKGIVLQHQHHNMIDLHSSLPGTTRATFSSILGAAKQKLTTKAVSFRKPYTTAITTAIYSPHGPSHRHRRHLSSRSRP